MTREIKPKAVLQDIKSFEQNLETMALLKLLALGQHQIEEGKIQPADEVVSRLRARNNNQL